MEASVNHFYDVITWNADIAEALYGFVSPTSVAEILFSGKANVIIINHKKPKTKNSKVKSD